MFRTARTVSLLLAFAAVVAPQADAAPPSSAAADFRDRVQPLLETYCVQCHGGPANKKPKANVNLAGPRDADRLAAEPDLWFRALDQVASGQMPPEGEKQPSAHERQVLAEWGRGYANLLVDRQRRDGRSKLRRLTRQEYVNTLEDLFGFRPSVATYLPSDGTADGYEKVSGALSMSADAALGYTRLAEEMLKDLFSIPKQQQQQKPAAGAPALEVPTDPAAAALAARTVRAMARDSGESPGHSLVLPDHGGTVVSFNTDTSSGRLQYNGARVAGTHRLRISTHGYQTDRPLPFGVYVGKTGAFPQQIELAAVLEAPPGAPAVLETDVYLKQGSGIRLIPFGLGVQVPKNHQASKCRGAGQAIQYVDVIEPEQPSVGHRWLTADFPQPLLDEVRRNPRAAFPVAPPPGKKPGGSGPKSIDRAGFLDVMRKTFARVGARLYRRDLAPPEVDAIVDAIAKRLDEAAPLREAFTEQLLAMMTSPDFLCVIERPGTLDDFALASRLSLFLWNAGPDDALLAVARSGKLRDPKVLAAQADRLLNDPRSQRFVEDFADQWLNLRAIADTSPDNKLYPGYSDLLRDASLRETYGTLARMLAGDRSVRELVASRDALVNEPLADLYGIPDVRGVAMRWVDLPANSPRGGLWTQSAIMKVTANGTNTSPVKRGVWVSERLLGVRIPPPPSDINPIEPDTRGAKTLREQLALHSQSQSCAACHAKFDPFGFALESFDVVGRFRTHYRIPDPAYGALPPEQRKGKQAWQNGPPVDPSGRTPDGKPFADAAGLRGLLASDPAPLAKGAASHLVTYATATPPGRVDGPAVEAISQAAAGREYGLRSLVHAVVQSDLFRSK